MEDTKKTNEQLIEELERLRKRVTELENLEADREHMEHDLQERIKELKCLYAITELAQSTDINVATLCEGVVIIVSMSYQYPDITAVKIVVNKKEYKTPNYRETEWMQCAEIKVHGEMVGNINVVYLEEKPEADEGPFLQDERQMIHSVAFRVGYIIEHMESEAALIDSKNRLNIIFENAPSAFYLSDLKGTFLDGNQAAENVTGYKREELIGKNFLKLNLLSPKQIPKAAKLLASNALGQSTGPDEFTLNRNNGSQIIVVIRTHPVIIQGQVQVLGIVQDITDRKMAEEALREAEEKSRAISDSAWDAIILIDDEGDVTYWNKAAENIFGYSAEEIMGRDLHALLVPQHYNDKFIAGLGKFKLTGKGAAIGKTLELEGVRKDGTEFPIELSLSAIKMQGKWHAVGIARDITERKQVQEEIERLATHDPLTNLNNRRSVMLKLNDQLKHTKRYKDAFCLIMLDIDHFKKVNDRYGHLVGDSVLVKTADLIRGNIRDVDTVGRYGGEEFIIILPKTELTACREVAERIRRAIEAVGMNDNENNLFKVTVSLGLSYYRDGDNETSIIDRADDALYKAKESGRNRIETED